MKRFRNVCDVLIGRGIWMKDPESGRGGGGGESGEGTGEGGAGKGGTDAGSGEASKRTDEPGAEATVEKLAEIEAEKAQLLKDVMKKKDANKALMTEVDALKTQLKSFEGIDLDRVNALIQGEKDRETQQLQAEGQWDTLRERMAGEHKKELSEAVSSRDVIINNLTAQLKKAGNSIDKLTVGHAFDGSRYIADELTLTPRKARIIYGPHFDADGDTLIAYDKPRGIEGRAPLVDGSGRSLSFEDAMRKIIATDPDADDLIRSKMKPGADSKTTDGKKAPEKKEALRGLSKIEAALEKSAS